MKMVNEFGQFITENVFDKSVNYYLRLKFGEWKESNMQNIYSDLSKLSDEDKKLIDEIASNIIYYTVSAFLLALQESYDGKKGYSITFNDTDICSQESEMNSGTLYGELQDWIEEYSNYKDF